MVTKSVPDELGGTKRNQYKDGQGSGVYIKAGTVVAILEFETEDGMIDKQDAHRAGGCNHIMDEKFIPTELNKQNPNEGGTYTFQENRSEELEPTRHRDVGAMEAKDNTTQTGALIDYSLLDKFLGEFYGRTAIGGPQKKLLPWTFFRSIL